AHPFPGEPLGERAADSARRPGDHRCLPAERSHRGSLLVVMALVEVAEAAYERSLEAWDQRPVDINQRLHALRDEHASQVLEPAGPADHLHELGKFPLRGENT